MATFEALAADPRAWAAAALLALVLMLAILRRAGRAARSADRLGRRVQALGEGQQRLSGALGHVAEAGAAAETRMLQVMEARLGEVGARMGETLHGSAEMTARSIGAVQQRLAAIDRAQANIEKLSGNVLGLQDILSNKQTRGAFGEIQLRDLLSQALPSDAYAWQATLPNGRRADALIHLPSPPGPMAVDAKFPLEAYEALREARTDRSRAAFRTAIRTHVRAIAERYVLPGRTADGALMFLPSEAVFAELHGHFPDLVAEAFAARVWIVSPTTCMATLTTMRAVMQDARLVREAAAIRRELALLGGDLGRLDARFDALERHFAAAARDLGEARTSMAKAASRAGRLHDFDFGDREPGDLAAE